MWSIWNSKVPEGSGKAQGRFRSGKLPDLFESFLLSFAVLVRPYDCLMLVTTLWEDCLDITVGLTFKFETFGWWNCLIRILRLKALKSFVNCWNLSVKDQSVSKQKNENITQELMNEWLGYLHLKFISCS